MSTGRGREVSSTNPFQTNREKDKKYPEVTILRIPSHKKRETVHIRVLEPDEDEF